MKANQNPEEMPNYVKYVTLRREAVKELECGNLRQAAENMFAANAAHIQYLKERNELAIRTANYQLKANFLLSIPE